VAQPTQNVSYDGHPVVARELPAHGPHEVLDRSVERVIGQPEDSPVPIPEARHEGQGRPELLGGLIALEQPIEALHGRIGIGLGIRGDQLVEERRRLRLEAPPPVVLGKRPSHHPSSLTYGCVPEPRRLHPPVGRPRSGSHGHRVEPERHAYRRTS
jgi:hypothetical protein